MSNVIYYTRSIADPRGNGGRRRTDQMVRLFAEFQPEIKLVQEGEPRWNRLDYLFARLLGPLNRWTWERMRRQWVTGGGYLRWAENRRYYLWLLRSSARHRAAELNPSSPPSLAIVDDPVYFLPLVKRLRKLNVPVVGLSQNLETLSRWQIVPKHQHTLFEGEIRAMQLCDLVVTVSNEENTILQWFGVNSVFHGYYPSPDVVESLLAIREQRARSTKAGILMAGSSGNRASLFGMKAVVEAWEQQRLGETGGTLRIAGFGTEELTSMVAANVSGVEILGPLDQPAFEQELISAKACICYQEDSSGALTRIAEMLIAGIPVVANSLACRTYYERPGIFEFDSLEMLGSTLRCVLDREPSVPVPGVPDREIVLRRVRALMAPGMGSPKTPTSGA